MARPRLDLQELFESFVENVYFQPPAGIRMEYPCIMYALDGDLTNRADNELYRHANRYQVTVVDRNPDTELKDLVRAMKYSSFDRFFAADDLNHYVFSVYF